MLIGSKNESDKNYSTITVGKDIILEGWSGIFITHNNKKSYGVVVNMNGTINSVDDANDGPGAGIYINGNIMDVNNSPVINLGNTAKITSTGDGIYSAGYATYNINGAYIEGNEAGLGIKSGVFNIINGTIIGNGLDKTPTSGNNNGINASGAAIQIESNPGYKGNIELYIKNGTIESKNSNVIYEYTVNNTETKVKKIDITGGTYTSKTNKDVFSLSNSFKSKHSNFISGGTFSSNPTSYLENGYSTDKDNNMYEVTTSTMQTFLEKENNNKPNTILIIPIISILIISIIIFLRYRKIR